jgi:glutathione S-transferase
VQRDLDWLESELQAGNGKFLVGDHVTAADTMMEFSVQFILTRKLGTGDKRWPAIEAWLQNIQNQESYKNAVEKTGYSL